MRPLAKRGNSDMRILRCTCTNKKELVDCDMTVQQQFDMKEVCHRCYWFWPLKADDNDCA